MCSTLECLVEHQCVHIHTHVRTVAIRMHSTKTHTQSERDIRNIYCNINYMHIHK